MLLVQLQAYGSSTGMNGHLPHAREIFTALGYFDLETSHVIPALSAQ